MDVGDAKEKQENQAERWPPSARVSPFRSLCYTSPFFLLVSLFFFAVCVLGVIAARAVLSLCARSYSPAVLVSVFFRCDFIASMPRWGTTCSCRICASKAAYVARRVRQRARARACGTLPTAPNSRVDNNKNDAVSNNDDNNACDGARLPGAENAPWYVLRAPRDHMAGFVASLVHTTPALAATAPCAIVVAACVGLGRSNGPLVVEMISCVKGSWVRCIAAMPPSVRRRCLLWLAIKSRERECRLCLPFASALCVRAAHAYWFDAGCATLAIVVVRRGPFSSGCAKDALTEHHGLPRTWDFMNAKGWKGKGGVTHLPQVDWIVRRNGTLVDPRGRTRDWTPIYPLPSSSSSLLQTGARAPVDADRGAPLPEPVGLLISGGSLPGGLAAWIASYATADERKRLLAPLASPQPCLARPPPARPTAAAPVICTRLPKSARPPARPDGPARSERAAVSYGTHRAPPVPPPDATTTTTPVTTSVVMRHAATAQVPRPRLLCGSGARCPTPSQTVCTDKRHVLVECDAGCRTCYHNACWRNRRTDHRGDNAVTPDEPCPTPDCWGALARVVSVGGAGLVEHVVWPRETTKGSDLGVRTRSADDADRHDAAVQRNRVQTHAHDRPFARDGTASACMATAAEPTYSHQVPVDAPPAPHPHQNSLPPPPQPLSSTAVTMTASEVALRDVPLPALMAHAGHDAKYGDLVDDDNGIDGDNGERGNGNKDNGPPSIYGTDGGAGRKKTQRVRAQKRQRVRARERAMWSAVVVDGPLAVDIATDDDLLWPEFFRP